MTLIIFFIISRFVHDFRNEEGKRICEVCHNSHNAQGPFLIKIQPHEELREIFKDFDFISLNCMNCHTNKTFLIYLFPNIGKFYEISETSKIFLGIEYYENNHPVGKSFITDKTRGIKCTTCHDPHLKDSKFLLRDQELTFCKECHFKISTFISFSKHFVLSCLNCHKIHRGVNRLLKSEDLCEECHFNNFHFKEENCFECHNPHKPEEKR
ncbi:MAG: cytochrome c3 family protein [Candidatus Hydrothermales bacterium]